MTPVRRGWGEHRTGLSAILLAAPALRVAWRTWSGPQVFRVEGYTFF